MSCKPLTSMKDDNPITAAKCALENNVLDLPGWRSLKRCAKRQKKLSQLAN